MAKTIKLMQRRALDRFSEEETDVTRLLVVLVLLLTAAPALASYEDCIVDRDVVNVRSGPGTSFDIVTQAHRGERGWISEHSNGWAKIIFTRSDMKDGWVREDLLAVGRKSEYESPSGSTTSDIDGVVAAFGIYLALAALLYFVPWFIAAGRGHHNTGAIFVLNLLLGWTFLGWVFALVWSLTAIRPELKHNAKGLPPGGPTQA